MVINYLSPADILWVYNVWNLSSIELAYKDFFLTQQIIGKQPNFEEWVFNTNTQMNAEGKLIPKEPRKFVVIEGDMKLPQLSNVTGGKCWTVVTEVGSLYVWATELSYPLRGKVWTTHKAMLLILKSSFA